MRPKSSSPGVLAAVTLLVLLVLALALQAGENEDRAAELGEQVAELRAQAEYARALDVARELLELRSSEEGVKRYQLEDAQRLVETLEFIAGMGAEAREEMAEADRLEARLQALTDAQEYVEGVEVGERLLEIRKRLLGDEHVDVALSKSDLAYLLGVQGDLDRAEQLYGEATDVQRAVLGSEHPDIALSLNGLGALSYYRGDVDGAVGYMSEALAMRRKCLGEKHPKVAAGLHNLALVLTEAGRLDEAEAYSRDALELARMLHGDDGPDVTFELYQLANLLYEKDEFEEAESLFRECVELEVEMYGAEHPEVAGTLNSIGRVLHARGEYEAAEERFHKSLMMYRSFFGDDIDVAIVLTNLANLLRETGEFERSVTLQRKALAIHRKLLGDEHPDVAMNLNGLGATLQDSGDTAGAEELFREALAMRRRLLGDEHWRTAMTLNNLGNVLHKKGDYAGAEKLHRESLAVRRRIFGDVHLDVAMSLGNLATVLGETGKYEAAIPLQEEALAIRRELLGREHVHVVMAQCNLAAEYRSMGDYDEAESLYREALETMRNRKGGSNYSFVRYLCGLGDVLSARGNHLEAEAVLREASEIYDAARLRVGSGRGRAEFLPSPLPALAASRLELGWEAEAWTAVERDLCRVLHELLVGADNRHLEAREAARLDSLRVTLGGLERKLEVCRSQVRADSTGEVAVLLGETQDRILDVEVELSQFQERMEEKYPVSEGRAYPLERVQAALPDDGCLMGWLDEETGPEGVASWVYVIRNEGPVVWERIGAAPEAVDETGTEDSTPSAASGDGRSPYDRTRQFRDVLCTRRTAATGVRRDASELWSERIGPIASALKGVEELIVVPSGAMLGVPVEALVDVDGVYVGDRFAVSYAPSATIHTWLRENSVDRVRQTDTDLLVVADPPFTEAHLAAMTDEDVADGRLPASAEPVVELSALRSAMSGNREALTGLPRLPGTRAEARAIESCYPGVTALVGPDASEQEICRLAESGEMGEYGVIHVATHGLVDDETPERSALVMSQVGLPDPLEAAMAGERIYDGLVTAKEIVSEWELNADLVTLSACETGLGRKVGGEGYVGFAHAFLQAGARSLLVSLWKVDDEATSLLMRRFYENSLGKYGDERNGRTGEPMSKADALREAKRWVRGYTDEYGNQLYEHPCYWSAFILMGDPS